MWLKNLVLILLILILIGKIDGVSFAENFTTPKNLTTTGNLIVTGNLTTTGNLTVTGNVTLNEKSNQNSCDSKCEDPNFSFLRSLALAVIPIVVGGIVTRFSTNFWQEKKDKIQTKKDILTDYDQSYKKQSVLLDTFVIRMYESYLTYDNDTMLQPHTSNKEKYVIHKIKGVEFTEVDGYQFYKEDKYNDKKREIIGFIKFPLLHKEEHPLRKLSREYEKLLSEIDKTVFSANRLFSNLRLFYQNSSDVIEELTKIDSKMDDLMGILGRMIYSRNIVDFVTFDHLYDELSEEVTADIKNFENDFVKLKLK